MVHRFINSSIAGVCCRKVLLDYFDEDTKRISSEAVCCYVCDSVKPEDMRDAQDEIKLVLKAVEDQPGFGEVKVHVPII